MNRTTRGSYPKHNFRSFENDFLHTSLLFKRGVRAHSFFLSILSLCLFALCSCSCSLCTVKRNCHEDDDKKEEKRRITPHFSDDFRLPTTPETRSHLSQHQIGWRSGEIWCWVVRYHFDFPLYLCKLLRARARLDEVVTFASGSMLFHAAAFD
jgi:hypothetical protein